MTCGWALLLLAIARPSAAALDLSGWRLFRSVQVASSAAGAYARLELDLAALNAASSGLADLRLVAADGTELPYKLAVSRGYTARRTTPAALTDLGREPERVSFTAELRYDIVQHNQLCLKTPSHDFRRTVSIESSPDRRAWRIIREGAVIFDVRADYRASHLCVSYPPSTQHWLRVSIQGKDEPRLDVAGAEAAYEDSSPGEESLWAVLPGGGRLEGRASVWDADLGAGRVPVSRIVFAAADANFQRAARAVELDTGPAGASLRRERVSAAIWRFSLPLIQNEELSLRGGEFSPKRFRVEVDNGDNPPLAVSSVAVLGPRHLLYVPADRPQPYRLYAGNSKALAPVYDLAAFAGYLDLSRSVPANFIEPEFSTNPAYREVDERAWSDRHRWVFLGSLAVLCLFLLGLIAQKAREILRELPPASPN